METVGLHPPARGLALPARAAPLGRSALGVRSGEPPLPVLVPCRALVDARGRPSTRWRGGWLASSTTWSTMSQSVTATTPANCARARCSTPASAAASPDTTSSCQTRRPSSDTPDCQWRTSSQSKSCAGHRSCRPAASPRTSLVRSPLPDWEVSRNGSRKSALRGRRRPRSGSVLED
jgi:hypothetical protein